MSVCSAIKPSGDRCRAQAMHDSQWCYVHDPDLADKRQRNNRKGGKRGGRGRGSGELVGIKDLLSELTDRVLGVEGTEPLGTGAAAVANQLINTRLRAAELERRLREEEELLVRIEQLEQAAEQQKGGRRWQA